MLKPALGAVLVALGGLILYKTPVGEPWVNASYDQLFRFGTRPATNRVVLVLADNAAFDQFHQVRGQPWDRILHAQLLNRLADDHCPLVIFDSLFRQAADPEKDRALAAAMRRQRQLVLMAGQAQVTHSELAGAEPTFPLPLFLDAARTNWGVAWLDPDLDHIVRKHWPFPSPGSFPSLPWTAARLAGASLDPEPQERWLRYYGEDGPWEKLSYRFALTQPTNYFSDKIVFIGTQPQTSLPDGEPDEFSDPYTGWNGKAVGGVELMATSFLNLVNRDWLQRPSPWIEFVILAFTGIVLGAGLYGLRSWMIAVLLVAAAVAIAVAAILLSYFTDYWFPWLVIVGGQMPLALVYAVAVKLRSGPRPEPIRLPKTPGYKLFNPPFGEGAYGKVWLALDAKGEWRALKTVYLSKFEDNPAPYEREFAGVSRYHAISDKHPGLLRVDFVSEKLDGYFYYVMELGDPLDPTWGHDPAKYKPRDLSSERAHLPGRRLPIRECVRIGLALTDALEFLHQNALTHRDIKPQNIIFVNDQPKMADLGLIAEVRPPEDVKTFVGTPGFMPPPPERPGTPEADIYALGMVLYVISTGRSATLFPEIATTLVDTQRPQEFFILNNVILKACQPEPEKRYASANEMREALLEAQKALEALAINPGDRSPL